MQRKLIFLFIVLFLFGSISAICDKNQIDINSASAEELDNIYGIGSAKAQNIIEYRQDKLFDSLDDLIYVKGIGNITLKEIKNEGLACVSEDKNNESTNEETSSDKIIDGNSSTDNVKIKNYNSNETNINREPVQRETIYLDDNPKDIKTKSNNQDNKRTNYSPILLLLSFGLLIGIIYFVKEKRKNMKNEFR
jgi:competence protein ComEA